MATNAKLTTTPDWLQSARDQWQWRGQSRPPFAQTPQPGQTSVWDFPRPPQIASDTREVVACWGEIEVARTRRAIKVLETSHPPCFYVPWSDVAKHLLQQQTGSSFCEWKGPAQYWALVNGSDRLDGAAWSYPRPLAGAEALADCVAFHAAGLTCTVGGATVTPQPGGFYGGWITPDLAGPFKGDPGSRGW
jgi:uncharacterized protein (DUF427 family)